MTHLNRYITILIASLTMLVAPLIHAQPISLILETDEDSQAGLEVYVTTLEKTEDLLNNNLSNPTAFSQLNIAPNYSIGGFAYDGNSYQLLLETDVDEQGGSEVFLVSFDSIDDLLSADYTGTYSHLNINPNFSIGGFAYDGLAYRMLLESDDDEDAESEVFLASFDSVEELLSGDISAGIFSEINIFPASV